MSFLQILGVLAALIAVVQIFIPSNTSNGNKVLIIVGLVLVSIFLLQCSPQGTTTDASNISPQSNNYDIQTNQETVDASTNEPSSPNVLRLYDANVVDYRYAKLTQGSYEDSFGNFYKQEVYFSSDFYGGDITFSPLGKYSNFRGIIAVGKYEDYHHDPMTIEIFGDGSSIYYTTITKTTEPISFDLNIIGVRQIKILADGHIIIGNGEFYN